MFFESLYFLAGNCITRPGKSSDESGFGGSKEIGLFFFHNLEFIVFQ